MQRQNKWRKNGWMSQVSGAGEMWSERHDNANGKCSPSSSNSSTFAVALFNSRVLIFKTKWSKKKGEETWGRQGALKICTKYILFFNNFREVYTTAKHAYTFVYVFTRKRWQKEKKICVWRKKTTKNRRGEQLMTEVIPTRPHGRKECVSLSLDGRFNFFL